MISEALSSRRERLERLKRIRRQGQVQPRILCPQCKREGEKEEIKKNGKLCPYCGHHFPMTPAERIRFLEDEKTFREMDQDLVSTDPLFFEGYKDKLKEMREKTRHRDAVVCGIMKMGEVPVAVAVMDSRFMMGSMGTVVGEKIARLTEYAGRKKIPASDFFGQRRSPYAGGTFCINANGKDGSCY